MKIDVHSGEKNGFPSKVSTFVVDNTASLHFKPISQCKAKENTSKQMYISKLNKRSFVEVQLSR